MYLRVHYYFPFTIKASFFITGIEGVTLMDIVKWMTGSTQILPLGFPKKFTLEFVHGACRAAAVGLQHLPVISL